VKEPCAVSACEGGVEERGGQGGGERDVRDVVCEKRHSTCQKRQNKCQKRPIAEGERKHKQMAMTNGESKELCHVS